MLKLRSWNNVLNSSADTVDHADVLHRVYKEVSEKLEAQSVARYMFQCNAITLKELQSIQSKHKKPVKAAERLLSTVIEQSSNVFSCFLDAVKNTGHQQVYKLIVTGICKGTNDDVLLAAFVTLWFITSPASGSEVL